MSQPSKQHLELTSICTTQRQTDRHTQTTYDMCSNRPHLRTACRRCGLRFSLVTEMKLS